MVFVVVVVVFPDVAVSISDKRRTKGEVVFSVSAPRCSKTALFIHVLWVRWQASYIKLCYYACLSFLLLLFLLFCHLSSSPCYSVFLLLTSSFIFKHRCWWWPRLSCNDVTAVGSETSLGSNVGILGVCGLDKPNPSLENLRQLSEQREHARVTDRLKGLKSREERNKTKFEQSKNQGI